MVSRSSLAVKSKGEQARRQLARLRPLPLWSWRFDRRTAGYTPVDLLTLGYFGLNLVLIGIGYRHLENAEGMLALFGSGFLVVALLRWVPRTGSLALQFVRDSYPLWLLPISYKSVGVVNKAIFQGYFDHVVLRWDFLLFRGHPNSYLAERFPYEPLSEFLHLCYWMYLLLVPILGFTLYFMGRYERFRVFATTISLTYYCCYTIFMLFPVMGPYYTFPRVTAPGTFFPELVYTVLERGAAVGAAFPSSHVAVSVVVALMAYRFCRVLWPLLLIAAAGITVGTVYGGFHYAIDAVAGLAFGVLAAHLGPRVHAALLRVLRPQRAAAGEMESEQFS